jgi:hypothetical protein
MDAKKIFLFGAGALVAVALLVGVGPRLPRGLRLDPETSPPYAGVFKADVGNVVSQTVKSLQAENRMIVFRYMGDVHTQSVDKYWPSLTAKQTLIVPATAIYFVDMSKFGPSSVRYSEASRTVDVQLPRLMIGDIGLKPEDAIEINDGILTLHSKVAADLAKKNYALARASVIDQARNPEFVQPAKAQAINNFRSLFEVPLRAVGVNDVEVKVHF